MPAQQSRSRECTHLRVCCCRIPMGLQKGAPLCMWQCLLWRLDVYMLAYSPQARYVQSQSFYSDQLSIKRFDKHFGRYESSNSSLVNRAVLISSSRHITASWRLQGFMALGRSKCQLCMPSMQMPGWRPCIVSRDICRLAPSRFGTGNADLGTTDVWGDGTLGMQAPRAPSSWHPAPPAQ